MNSCSSFNFEEANLSTMRKYLTIIRRADCTPYTLMPNGSTAAEWALLYVEHTYAKRRLKTNRGRHQHQPPPSSERKTRAAMLDKDNNVNMAASKAKQLQQQASQEEEEEEDSEDNDEEDDSEEEEETEDSDKNTVATSPKDSEESARESRMHSCQSNMSISSSLGSGSDNSPTDANMYSTSSSDNSPTCTT